MPDRFGLKTYEIRTLILAVVFGLAGAVLHEALGDVGEYIALFVCLPPPLAFYVFNVWSNKKPSL